VADVFERACVSSDKFPPPEGRSTKFAERIFRVGETRRIMSVRGASPFAPPEKILRVRSLPDLRMCFGLPSGELADISPKAARYSCQDANYPIGWTEHLIISAALFDVSRLQGDVQMNRIFPVAALAVLLCAGCQLPNQSTVPPSIYLTFTSGNGSPTGANNANPIHVDPNQPVSILVSAYSSLSGLKSLELDPDTSFNCINGDIGQEGNPTYAPIIKTAPATPGPTLKLSAEMDLGTPASSCKPGWKVNWSGSFTARATSYNGLSTKSGPLNLVSP